MENFGFYLVMTNPKVGYVACAEAAVRAGVAMHRQQARLAVQLCRWQAWSTAMMAATATISRKAVPLALMRRAAVAAVSARG